MTSGRYFFFCYLIFFLFLFFPLSSDYRIKGESISVESSVSFSELFGVGDVIEIKPYEGMTLGDIFKISGIVDINDRNGFGIYGDVRMRGSTFSQVLICIDGIPIYNYYSAHLNLTLPVSPELIEKIEVIPGPSGSIFGANGIGGVINIITKRDAKKGSSISLSAGSNSLFKITAGGEYERGKNGILFSLSLNRRDGFIYDRDYTVKKGNFFHIYENGDFKFYSKFMVGDYKIGENNFFASFPSYERIKNYISFFSMEKGGDRLDLSLSRCDDEFILVRDNPQIFSTENQTENVILRYTHVGNLFGKISFRFLADLRSHYLDSITMESHSFKNFGVGAILSSYLIGNLRGNFALRYDYFSIFNNRLTGGFSLIYDFGKNRKISLSVESGYRVPSFVELYYNSPSNHGNPQLKPETSLGENFSLQFGRKIKYKFSLFYRRDRRLIDWIYVNRSFWKALNVSAVNIYGLEFNMGYSSDFFSVNFFYSHINEEFCGADFLLLKYGREYMKDKFKTEMSIKVYKELKINSIFYFGNKSYGEKFFPVDFSIKKELKVGNFFIEVKNVFDERYESMKGIVAPFRSFEIGFNLISGGGI